MNKYEVLSDATDENGVMSNLLEFKRSCYGIFVRSNQIVKCKVFNTFPSQFNFGPFSEGSVKLTFAVNALRQTSAI